jgi:HEPN domain
MESPEKIKELAVERLDEARILYENGKYDGSFYLAGYSVELMLKAKICERMGIPNLFDEVNSNQNLDASERRGLDEIKKVVKTHNLFTLLIFSGLKVKIDEEKALNEIFSSGCALLFSKWNEKIRYKVIGHITSQEARIMIQFLTMENNLLTWIEQN